MRWLAAVVALLLLATPAIATATVFGPDDRAAVDPTTVLPYRAIAFVQASSYCTGFLVGPNVALTAAHCIYDRQNGRYATPSAFAPGQSQWIGGWPYGSWPARSVWVPSAYQQGSTLYDYGVIVLDRSDPRVGWLTIGLLSDRSLTDPSLAPTVSGYPAAITWWGRQATASTTGPVSVDQRVTLLFRTSLTPGESGAPVYRRADSLVVGLAVGENDQTNFGRRIDRELVDDLRTVCARERCGFAYFDEASGRTASVGINRVALPFTVRMSS